MRGPLNLTIRLGKDEGKPVGSNALGRTKCEWIRNHTVGEGHFCEFEEMTTAFLRQRIDIGGLGGVGDELGGGGETETGSCLGWLESYWKCWMSLLSDSGARSWDQLTLRQHGTALGCSNFGTLDFILIMYGFEEILDLDLDV
jgi:hypothetical protein